MFKLDLLWVALKVFGLYAVTRALLAVPSMFTSAYRLYAVHKLARTLQVSAQKNALDVIQNAIHSTGSLALASLATFLVFGLVATLALARTNWLVTILSNGKSYPQANEEPKGGAPAAAGAREAQAAEPEPAGTGHEDKYETNDNANDAKAANGND